MDLKDSKPVLALKRHLQKYLKKLLSDIKEIEARETDSKIVVTSLANLLEQKQCVANVDVTSVSVTSQFPDLQPKLLAKISAEVDAKLEKLTDLMEPLRKHHNVVYRARDEILNLIRKHPNDLDVHTLTSSQPTVPLLTVMFDLVDAIERQAREIYHTRMYYLENVGYQEIINSESLVHLWTEDIPAFLETVKDCQQQTKYFLQGKYE